MSDMARTVAEAKTSFFTEAEKDGSKCPCCMRYGKVYKRSINSSMAAVLILLHRYKHLGFTHVPTLINETAKASVAAAIRGDFAKLRYWGLIEEGFFVVDSSKKYNGTWRITPAGERFAKGEIRVSKYGWVYNTKLLRFGGPQVTIHDALTNKFDYTALMGA